MTTQGVEDSLQESGDRWNTAGRFCLNIVLVETQINRVD